MYLEPEIRRYLQLFGLDSKATLNDLRDAYHDLMMVWHPDRFTHDERLRRKAEACTKDLNQGYELLSVYLDLKERPSTSKTKKASRVKTATKVRRSAFAKRPGLHDALALISKPFKVFYATLERTFWWLFRGQISTCFVILLAFLWLQDKGNMRGSSEGRQVLTSSASVMNGYRLLNRNSAGFKRVTTRSGSGATAWDATHKPAIIQAAINCDLGQAKNLIARKINPDARDEFGDSALAWAAKRDCKSVAELLLSHGASIHSIADNGLTPKIWARMFSNPDIIQLFERRDTKLLRM